MRDEGDMQAMTLTERVGRLESVAKNAGYDLSDYSVRSEDKIAQHREQAMRYEDRNANVRDVRKDPTAFEEITNRIQQSTERVYVQALKLEEIGARVYGPSPEETGDDKAAINAVPTLDQTFVVLNRLDYALSRLHTAAARLERI